MPALEPPANIPCSTIIPQMGPSTQQDRLNELLLQEGLAESILMGTRKYFGNTGHARSFLAHTKPL